MSSPDTDSPKCAGFTSLRNVLLFSNIFLIFSIFSRTNIWRLFSNVKISSQRINISEIRNRNVSRKSNFSRIWNRQFSLTVKQFLEMTAAIRLTTTPSWRLMKTFRIWTSLQVLNNGQSEDVHYSDHYIFWIFFFIKNLFNIKTQGSE